MFYGWRTSEGRQGGAYFKLANSLSEALADLEVNPGVSGVSGGYLVRDAFLEVGEGGPVLHVELISKHEIMAGVLERA